MLLDFIGALVRRPAALAYIAGMVDGEGSIFIGIKDKKHRFQLVVTISNSSKSLLNWIKEVLKCGNVYEYRRKKKGKSYPVEYTWRVEGVSAYRVLRLLYPYLRIKKPQADIAFAFHKLAKEKRIRQRLTPEDIKMRRSLYERMKQAKKDVCTWT